MFFLLLNPFKNLDNSHLRTHTVFTLLSKENESKTVDYLSKIRLWKYFLNFESLKSPISIWKQLLISSNFGVWICELLVYFGNSTVFEESVEKVGEIYQCKAFGQQMQQYAANQGLRE